VYGLLFAALAIIWHPLTIAAIGPLAAALCALNRPLYRFFFRKRGLWFTVRAVYWHWFYFLYSGLAFAIGTARHLFNAAWSGLSALAGSPHGAQVPPSPFRQASYDENRTAQDTTTQGRFPKQDAIRSGS
jgi:hypothetical protein